MKHQGQTLVEGIIAIFIILTGVVGMLILGISSLSGSTESLDQVKAINFAREAIEVIRNRRDSNWLADLDYNTGFDPYEEPEILARQVRINFTNNWEIENLSSTGFNPEECEPTCQLFFHPSTGIYNHNDDGQGTNFYRVVEFNEICYLYDYPLSKFRVKPNDGWCKDDWELDPDDFYESGIQVLVKVGWQEKGQFRTTTLEDRLYNWK